jgi:hypothetical protein
VLFYILRKIYISIAAYFSKVSTILCYTTVGISSVAPTSEVCALVRCVFVTECMKYTELGVDSNVDFVPVSLNIG